MENIILSSLYVIIQYIASVEKLETGNFCDI